MDGQGMVDGQAWLSALLVLTHTAADPLRNDVMWGFSLFVASVARIHSLLALIPQASGKNGDNMFSKPSHELVLRPPLLGLPAWTYRSLNSYSNTLTRMYE